MLDIWNEKIVNMAQKTCAYNGCVHPCTPISKFTGTTKRPFGQLAGNYLHIDYFFIHFQLIFATGIN